MNEELNYAEMLEIPVETVTVKRKEKKRRARENDSELSEQLVEQINDRMEEADDPAYAESREIEREVKPTAKANRKTKMARRVLIGEFVAVCALCAAIFVTNIVMSNSAINTFVRGLFRGGSRRAHLFRFQTWFRRQRIYRRGAYRFDFGRAFVHREMFRLRALRREGRFDQRHAGRRLYRRTETFRYLLDHHQRSRRGVLCRGAEGKEQRSARLLRRRGLRARHVLFGGFSS